MSEKIKCVLCQSDMKGGHWNRYCTNDDCKLSYRVEKTSFDWSRFFWLCIHPDFKSYYYTIKNTLFKRYDLIRTNTGKGHWCDKDHLMFKGMMGLLVDYIELECGRSEWFDVSGWGDYTNSDDIPIPDVIISTYVDYKITYPKLMQAESDALNAWSDSSNMVMGDVEDRGLRSLHFESTDGYTDEQRHELFVIHTQCEKDVADFEQKLLHRLIDIRQYLWT